MVKNITQSSHHKFRVSHTREYNLRATTIKESEHHTQVMINNSLALFGSPSSEGGSAAIVKKGKNAIAQLGFVKRRCKI